MNKTITLRIDEDKYEEYKQQCKMHGLSPSKEFSKFINTEIELKDEQIIFSVYFDTNIKDFVMRFDSYDDLKLLAAMKSMEKQFSGIADKIHKKAIDNIMAHKRMRQEMQENMIKDGFYKK